MSDLISRQKALDGLKYEMKYGAEIDRCGLDTAYDIIEDLPSTDPERKKKGEWIDEKINSYTSRTYCSECGSSAPFVYKSDDYYGNHAHGETAKTKFCPNCGADMRGEHE